MKKHKSEALKEGDTFTIEGCGKSKTGLDVISGRSVKSGRKCKAVTLTKFYVLGRSVEQWGGDIKPATLP